MLVSVRLSMMSCSLIALGLGTSARVYSEVLSSTIGTTQVRLDGYHDDYDEI